MSFMGAFDVPGSSGMSGMLKDGAGSPGTAAPVPTLAGKVARATGACSARITEQTAA